MGALPAISEIKRQVSPAPTPQALAWRDGELWFGSRDLSSVYRMDPENWKVMEEVEPPGIPWAAASVGDSIWFTLGEGPDDDRYLRRYVPGKGFTDTPRVPCPDDAGSYLSYDGSNLYLSQWYKHRILKLDSDWSIVREIAIGAEVSGHVFVNGLIYVLRGTEQDGGDWRLARVDPREATPKIEDLAQVPFQCRSLTWDGGRFWTNHREADRIVCFAMPN